MATKKFSEFDSVPTPVLADIELVGLDDAGQNARFPGSAFDGAAWGNITGTLADQTDLNSALNGKEDSLGNPGTNGYVLSSTTGGVRSWIPNGSGSVAWGAITGTLSAQTDLQEALNTKHTPLFEAITTDIILAIVLGDSNELGIGGTGGTLTLNTDVYLYATTGTGTYNSGGNLLQWRNVDPTDPIVTDIGSVPAGEAYIGALRNNNGATSLALGDRLQKRFGLPVYVFAAGLGGSNSRYWLTGEGGRATLDNYLQDALDALPGGAIPAHVVFMSNGSNDCNASNPDGIIPPTEFADNTLELYDYMVSEGWITQNETMWYQQEPSQTYGGYAGGIWLGTQYLSNASNGTIKIISSVGLETSDTVHFVPAALTYMGFAAADDISSGPQTKPLTVPNSYVETLNPVFGGDIDVAEFTLNNVTMLAATGTPADGITLRVDNSANYDFSYIANAGLTVATIKSGGLSGACFDSNMTASAAFPAFRFVHSQTQSGSASIASFGHAGLVDAFTISRTGDVAAAGTVTADDLHATARFSTNLSGEIWHAVNTRLQTGVISSNVAATGTPDGFVLNTANTFTNAGSNLLSITNNGTEEYAFGYNGILTLNGLVFDGTIAGTGAIATSGAIGTTASMTALNLTCASGTVSAQFMQTNQIATDGTAGQPFIIRVDNNSSYDMVYGAAFDAGLLTLGGPNGVIMGSRIGAATAYTAFNMVATATMTTGNLWSLGHGGGTKITVDSEGLMTCKGLAPGYRAVSGTSDTITRADSLVAYSSTSTVTATLPSAVTYPGLELTIKKTGASGTVNVTSVSSQTFDGAASPLAISTQWHLVRIKSNGANWLVLQTGAP